MFFIGVVVFAAGRSVVAGVSSQCRRQLLRLPYQSFVIIGLHRLLQEALLLQEVLVEFLVADIIMPSLLGVSREKDYTKLDIKS